MFKNMTSPQSFDFLLRNVSVIIGFFSRYTLYVVHQHYISQLKMSTKYIYMKLDNDLRAWRSRISLSHRLLHG